VPIKTLYVRDEDVPMWIAAEKFAKQTRQSLSQLLAAALQSYLSMTHPANDEFGEITVRVGAHERASWTEGFIGRWLIAPHNKNRWGNDARLCYGVALTRGGRIAVYRCQLNDGWPHSLAFYDHLDELARAEGWRSHWVFGAIAFRLGEQGVIWRDV